MKPEDMLDEIGSIDDKLVIEADTDSSIKKTRKSLRMTRLITSIAACVVILLAATFIIPLILDKIIDDPSASPIHILPLTARALEAPITAGRNIQVEVAATGANDFAFRLSAALAENVGTDNFIVSPYSVWLPLAALVNATEPQYKDALLSALSAAGVSEDDLNSAASRMLFDLTRDIYYRENESGYDAEYGITHHNPLKIANAIFVDKNQTLNRNFAQKFLDYYRGAAISADFSSHEAVDAVNKWARDNTQGLIDNIISEFDPQTVAAIANAIYFSDRWEWEFNPDRTAEDIFYSPNGESTAHFMLREGDGQMYYEDEKVQAIPLWFKTGGGMYIILPKDGDATGLLTSMTNDYFNSIRHNAQFADGKLLLPRFKIESPLMQLSDVLTALGIPLFDEISAPLTGGLIEENIPVWLGSALQKAFINVDEEGTTAAAVTIMPAPGAGMPEPTPPFEMICNTPFVFVLYSHTYDGGSQVLFTGIVNQP
ncbi:MAG: hypothetical protein FWD44_07790 [Oscillospiraceae bacterium]|nr:hypothetical protein [Oscillospiraceae bacterium]